MAVVPEGIEDVRCLKTSFPASAQFSFLMSVRMIWTASGVQPSARQVPSVSSFASLRRCSRVRPSNIWTLIIGMVFSLAQFLWSIVTWPGCACDARQPGGDVRDSVAGRTRPRRAHVRVGIERDVGEAEAVADEERMAREMLLHHAERGVALLHACSGSSISCCGVSLAKKCFQKRATAM